MYKRKIIEKKERIAFNFETRGAMIFVKPDTPDAAWQEALKKERFITTVYIPVNNSAEVDKAFAFATHVREVSPAIKITLGPITPDIRTAYHDQIEAVNIEAVATNFHDWADLLEACSDIGPPGGFSR